MWWWNDGWSWGAMLIMTLSMVLFWALLIGGIVWAIRSSGSRSTGGSDAREVVRDRFARGEIDEEQYRRTLKALNESDHRSSSRGMGPP